MSDKPYYLKRTFEFLKDKNIEQLRTNFFEIDTDHIVKSSIDEMTEVLTIEYPVQDDKGEWSLEKETKSFPTHLAVEFFKIAQSEFDSIKVDFGNLGIVISDRIQNDFILIILAHNESTLILKYPHIRELILKMKNRAEYYFGVTIPSHKEETRGNPKYRDERLISDEKLLELIDKANQLLTDNPNEYMPRKNAYTSNAINSVLSTEQLSLEVIGNAFRTRTYFDGTKFHLLKNLKI